MNEFYNDAIKNRYLDDIGNEGSRNTIKYIFIASKGAEEIKEMDLYNFSKEDIELVLKNMTITSLHTARSNTNYIYNYIAWCIKHGYRENNLNPLDTIDKNWYSKFVDRTIKVHYSYEEFIDLLESLHNAADQSLLCLFWEGIVGRSFSQLRELKFEDIRWDSNEIYVRERDQIIKVSDICIKYLGKTQRENTYFTYNPETSESSESELLPSPYVFKNIKSPRSVEGQAVNPSVMYKRLNLIREEFSLEHLTPNGIKQSGMLWQAVQIYYRDGNFGFYKQIAEIGDKYNYTTVKSADGTVYYNSSLMKVFVSPQNFKDLYDIDITFKE